MASFISGSLSLPMIFDDYTSSKRSRGENDDETSTKRSKSALRIPTLTPAIFLNDQLINIETKTHVKRKVTFQERPGGVLQKVIPTMTELAKSLEQLKLPSFNVLLTAEQQGWVLRTFEHLSLNIPLEAAYLMSDFELRYFSEAYPDITRLAIPESKYISDAGLKFIIDAGTELRSIEITRCERITDATLIAISQKCPKLTSFSVIECKGVTNVGVMALARCCTELTTLNLDWVSNLRDSSLRVIGRSLSKLTELTLCECTKITRIGFEAVLKGNPGLKILELWGCKQVNDQWIDAIIKAKIPLTSLDIQGCKVTVNAIAKLYAYYPDLILNFDLVAKQQVPKD